MQGFAQKKIYQPPAKQNVEVATPLGIVSFIPSSSPDRIKKWNPARLTAGKLCPLSLQITLLKQRIRKSDIVIHVVILHQGL